MTGVGTSRRLVGDEPGFAEAVREYVAGCNPDGECVVRNVKKYGEICLNYRRMLAHRAVAVLRDGPIPEGLVVRHTCDRPQCVEANHLIIGTQSQNRRDMYERRRNANPGVAGEANAGAILTDSVVGRLRREARNGASITDLAAAYGLGHSSVFCAVRGQSWTHVPEPPVTHTPKPYPASSRRVPVEDVEEARSLAAAGWSLSQIGDHLGLNRVTVHRAMARTP